MSQHLFEPNDIVRCIDRGANTRIKTGRLYRVVRRHPQFYSEYRVDVSDANAPRGVIPYSYMHLRFALVHRHTANTNERVPV